MAFLIEINYFLLLSMHAFAHIITLSDSKHKPECSNASTSATVEQRAHNGSVAMGCVSRVLLCGTQLCESFARDTKQHFVQNGVSIALAFASVVAHDKIFESNVIF